MKDNDYQLIEHLKLIEQQIQRMADNSFKVKNWALTVVGGALLYWLKEETPKSNKLWLILLIVLATLIFWWLDAYYLTLEKCSRKLYMKVEGGKEDSYSLSIREYLGQFNIICVAITSKTYTHTYVLLILFEIVLFLSKYLKL